MKIKNAKGRTDGNSGYARTLGNENLGQLISRVQATVISNGTELERLIVARCKTIDDIDNFILQAEDGEVSDDAYLCVKRVFKKSKKYCTSDIRGIEPDLLIFIVEKKRICKVVELKDGDAFDTKKARSEREALEKFATNFGAKIPFSTNYFICTFNQENKETIYEGFKKEFDLEHILTGKELCAILKITYDEIVKLRTNDATENFNYFIDELLAIPEVKCAIEKKCKNNLCFAT